MTYMPDNEETWSKTTSGRPLKIGKDVYFMKTRMTRRRLSVYLPVLMFDEMKLNYGEIYTIRMKEIATGKIHNTTLKLERNPDNSEMNRWPAFSYIPDDCDVGTGCKLYGRLTTVDMGVWFDSDMEIRPEEMTY